MKQTEFIRRLTDVMESHKQRLFRYACYRTGSVAEAEDILQDLYLRLLERQHEVEKAANLPAYIFRSLANACSSRTIAPHYVDLSSYEVRLSNKFRRPLFINYTLKNKAFMLRFSAKAFVMS